MGSTRRTAALFLAALVGVLVVIGLALSAWTPWVLVPYAALVALLARGLVRRAAELRRPAGRTCACCTTTVFDPVEVR